MDHVGWVLLSRSQIGTRVFGPKAWWSQYGRLAHLSLGMLTGGSQICILHHFPAVWSLEHPHLTPAMSIQTYSVEAVCSPSTGGCEFVYVWLNRAFWSNTEKNQGDRLIYAPILARPV